MTADDLRDDLDAAREELGAAIRALAGRWEEPCLPSEEPQVDPGAEVATWTPRQAMQHAIIGHLFHGQLLARALLDLPRPEDALAALATLSRAYDAVAEQVGDADLTRFASVISESQQRYLARLGVEPRQDLETVLRLSAAHLRDHADQLLKAQA